MTRTGMTRDSIYRLGRMGQFPRPIKLSERSSGWLEHEVDAFIDRRASARDAVRSPVQPKR
jgi:prophage regulatory protein